MKKITHTLFQWGPAVIWMAIIFYFSSRQRLSVSETFALNFLFFKTLHVIEYALLYFFILRGLAFGKSKLTTQTYLIAFGLTFLYAVSDEVHQSFVPTREAAPRDVLIDSLGMLCMLFFINVHYSRLKKLFFSASI